MNINEPIKIYWVRETPGGMVLCDSETLKGVRPLTDAEYAEMHKPTENEKSHSIMIILKQEDSGDTGLEGFAKDIYKKQNT